MQNSSLIPLKYTVKNNLDIALRLTSGIFGTFWDLSYPTSLSDVYLKDCFTKKPYAHSPFSRWQLYFNLIHCISAHCIDLWSVSVQVNLF